MTPRASKNNEPGQTIYIDHRGLISSFKRMSCEKNPPKNLRAIVPQSQHSSPTCRGRRRPSPRQVVAPCTSHTARTVVLSISAGLPRVCGAGRDGLRSTARRVNRGFIGYLVAFNRAFHRQLLSAGGRTRSHSHWRAREVHVRRVDREHRCRARSESIPRRATVPVRGRDRRRRPFSARTESSRPSDVPTRRSGQLS